MCNFFLPRLVVINPLQVPFNMGFFMCTCDNWFIVIEKMKDTCLVVVVVFIEKLDQRFYSHELMNATKIIYPLYWLNFNANSTFLACLAFLKT